MMVFIIDRNLRKQIKKTVAFANKNPFTMDDMLDIYNNQKPPAGQREGHWFKTSQGIRISYCIEYQVVGKTKSLSVNVERDYVLPNPIMVEEIMILFGFTKNLLECHINLEKYGEKRRGIGIREIIE